HAGQHAEKIDEGILDRNKARSRLRLSHRGWNAPSRTLTLRVTPSLLPSHGTGGKRTFRFADRKSTNNKRRRALDVLLSDINRQSLLSGCLARYCLNASRSSDHPYERLMASAKAGGSKRLSSRRL